MTYLTDLRERIRSGGVVRYHAAPPIPPQSLSSHQWRVAQIAHYIWPECSVSVLMHALSHDMEELYTGDIPAMTKLALGEAVGEMERRARDRLDGFIDPGIVFGDSLKDTERAFVRGCDYLELTLYCMENPSDISNRIADQGMRFVAEAVPKMEPEIGERFSQILSEVSKLRLLNVVHKVF